MSNRNIYVTKSYDKFAIIKVNRKISPRKVAKLEKSNEGGISWN